MIWNTYPIYLVLGGVLVSLSGFAWFIGNGDGQVTKLPKPRLLFSSIGKVVEIPDGSMERFTDLLQQNEITAVLLYAPWCGQSSAVAKEFNRAAKVLYKEVSFIAINCWIGSCNKQQRVDQFPKVIAIHSHFDRVEYSGHHTTSKMIRFLQSIIRPFIYIGTAAELSTVKQSKQQELIISYFHQPMRSDKNYTRFFNLALQFTAKDSTPTFAVVTSAQLALKAGLNCVSGISYHRLNQPVLNYPSSNNFTVETLSSWIDANRYELVVELTLKSGKKEQFVHQLSKGPALILFLPLKRQMSQENQHLLDTYMSTASQYFNCSCRRKRNQTRNTSQDLNLLNYRTNSPITIKQVRLRDEILDSLPTINAQGDFMVTSKEWRLSVLQAPKSTCQCLRILQKSSLDNKLKVCEVCYYCERQICHLNLRPGLQNLVNEVFSLRNGCSSFRSGYYQSFTTSICCSVEMKEAIADLSFQRQQKPFYLESLKQMRRSWDDLLSELLVALSPPVTKEALPALDHEVIGGNVKTSPQQGPLNEFYDTIHTHSVDQDDKNLCAGTDNVAQFTGAGCFSNKSVNFFLMDSTQYWDVAEKLGVRNKPRGRTALIIADLEADAQFVLDEDLQITNASIVAFVMAYMAGNLTRRFSSKSARPSSCLASQACVVEVETSNFHKLVLDETKDVFLLYYAPWCAYCQALGPVLLAVAKFFHKTTGVIIARINADDNDLPWEFYVPRYPSFVFFPAYRKDFTVRFPDSVERTGANIVQFILDHGVLARKVFKDFRLSRIVTDQVNDLEILK